MLFGRMIPFPRLAAARRAGLVLLLALASTTLADPSETRQAFLKLIDRSRVDLAAKESSSESDGLLRVDFSFASEASQRVPGILLVKPGEGRRPAVIVLHGTGGKKEGELGYTRQLAARGFAAVSIDGRYHGERGTPADYNRAIASAFERGGEHPLYYDTVWDVMRLVDYLSTRPDIDPQRIGLMGISKGGIETYFTSAADERIAASVPCIGVQSFNWALENDKWQARVGTVKKGFDAAAKSAAVEKPDAAFVRRFYDRVVPGIYNDFDGPVMLTLIAPRPLMIINGDKDPNTPLDGVMLAADSARKAYDAAGVADHFKQIVERDTPHKVNPEAFDAAVGWFAKWLLNAPKE
jgi:dienelactone hydrolase